MGNEKGFDNEASSEFQSHENKKKERERRKVEKRKWREEKLIKKFEKEKQKEIEDTKRLKLEQENDKGRHYTVSIALPGSILDNAQSQELRTYLVGQIARAAVVFNVDEIIVFDESGTMTKDLNDDALNKKSRCCIQMTRILQYLECPQYLRKAFFPHHKDLQYAGLLNPLDSPHHMRQDDDVEYREGVVINKPVKQGHGSFVNVGLLKEVQITQKLEPGTRVTVHLDQSSLGKTKKGVAVSSSLPRTKSGLYWGYRTRTASSLSAVFTESIYEGGYDCTIGTSERGSNIDQFVMPSFKHMLIVFGGLNGLEASVDADPDLEVDDPKSLFEHYLNTCPAQGSRTIRTEEAVLITLSLLRPKIAALHLDNTGTS